MIVVVVIGNELLIGHGLPQLGNTFGSGLMLSTSSGLDHLDLEIGLTCFKIAKIIYIL